MSVIAHPLERRIGPGVNRSRLAIEINSLTIDDVQPLGLRHGERAQQQRINKPECRCARADRKSQRKDRRGGGHLLLHKLAKAEDGIGAE